jgi:hypothetical protein
MVKKLIQHYDCCGERTLKHILLKCVSALIFTAVLLSAAHAAAGYTVGNFAVGQSGGATYSVPITVPHGIADLQPALSLDYSSQAGPGLAGLGWNLSGIASISRCPRTKRQDGINGAITFTSADRFCLNGQRLVLDGTAFAYGAIGATYRTEGETFSRVTAATSTITGQMYFKMQTKSGLVYEFGNTSDSAVKPGPSVAGATVPTVPLLWAVNQVSDRLGNSMQFAYTSTSATGSYVIDRITYNAGKAYVKFVSTIVSSASAKFLAGTKIGGGYLLSSIESHVINLSGTTDQLIKKYILAYESTGLNGIADAARLSSITECGSIAGACLPPVTFEWGFPKNSQRQFALTSSIQSASLLTGVAAVDEFYGSPGYADESVTPRFLADINGDGLTDIIGFKGDGVHFLLGSDSGYMMGINPSLAAFGVSQGWTDQSNYPRQLVDINGDGFLDIIGFTPGGAYASIWNRVTSSFDVPFLATGSFGHQTGWRTIVANGKGSLALISDQEVPRFFVDMNIDGYPDIVGIGPDGVYISYGDGRLFGLPIKVSPEFCYNTVFVGYGCGAEWYKQSQTPRQLIDMNGDGYPDLVGFRSDGVVIAMWDPILQNFGLSALVLTQFGSTPNTATGSVYWADDNIYPRRLVDVNGDGYPDVVGFSPSGVYVSLWDGTKFQQPKLWTTKLSGGVWLNESVNPRTLIDINSDGYPDLVAFGTDGIHVLMNTGSSFVDDGTGVTKWSSELKSTVNVDGETYNNEGAYPRKFADLDGDGIPEIVAFGKFGIFGTGPVYASSRSVYSNTAGPSSRAGTRIAAINDSLGSRTEIQYSLMSGATSYYTRGASVAPLRDVIGPMVIVTQVARSDGLGAGGMVRARYRYGGFKVHRDYGSLGFEWMAVRDEQTGLETKTTYSQSYPFTGQALVTETAKSTLVNGMVLNGCDEPGTLCQQQFTVTRNGTPLSRSTVTPSWESMGVAGEYALNTRIFSFTQKVIDEVWALDGTALPTKTTTYLYELGPQGGKQWGAITNVTVLLSDGHKTENKNIYYPGDEDNWLVAKIDRASVTDTRPARTITTAAPSGRAPGSQQAPPIFLPTLSAILSVLLDD